MGQLPEFDTLKQLAESDPKAFDELRQAYCQEFIGSVPCRHKQRMQAIQHRVDTVITRSKTPMAGLIKVSCMMHDSLSRLASQLNSFQDYTLYGSRPAIKKSADVIYLAERKHRRSPRADAEKH